MHNSATTLFLCSGLLLSCSAVLGGSAAWSVLRMSYYFWVSDLGTELGAGVLMVAGSMLCLPACWLASLVPYHPRALSLLGTLMVLSAAAMLTMSLGMSSLSALSRVVRQPELLNASMSRAMARANLEPSVRSAFSSMQLELRCCGVQSNNDWYRHRRTLPAACCNRWAHGKRDTCDKALFTSGCLAPALVELRYFINSTTMLASALIIVLAVTMFAAVFWLVSTVVERGEAAPKTVEPLPTLRVACLHQPVPEIMTQLPPPATAPSLAHAPRH